MTRFRLDLAPVAGTIEIDGVDVTSLVEAVEAFSARDQPTRLVVYRTAQGSIDGDCVVHVVDPMGAADKFRSLDASEVERAALNRAVVPKWRSNGPRGSRRAIVGAERASAALTAPQMLSAPRVPDRFRCHRGARHRRAGSPAPRRHRPRVPARRLARVSATGSRPPGHAVVIVSGGDPHRLDYLPGGEHGAWRPGDVMLKASSADRAVAGLAALRKPLHITRSWARCNRFEHRAASGARPRTALTRVRP
ncbi:MAG TPA: hypothetical protein VHA73_11680 [Acidimicrobiales bacterium]|jgi:hypothetical protein|nr:hypothetical protein [Acidimicrobiales bacterium]